MRPEGGRCLSGSRGLVVRELATLYWFGLEALSCLRLEALFRRCRTFGFLPPAIGGRVPCLLVTPPLFSTAFGKVAWGSGCCAWLATRSSFCVRTNAPWTSSCRDAGLRGPSLGDSALVPARVPERLMRCSSASSSFRRDLACATWARCCGAAPPRNPGRVAARSGVCARECAPLDSTDCELACHSVLMSLNRDCAVAGRDGRIESAQSRPAHQDVCGILPQKYSLFHTFEVYNGRVMPLEALHIQVMSINSLHSSGIFGQFLRN